MHAEFDVWFQLFFVLFCLGCVCAAGCGLEKLFEWLAHKRFARMLRFR